jgi:DNA-binding MarR family transcriptional regulator
MPTNTDFDTDIATSFFEIIPRLHELLRQGRGGRMQLDALHPSGPDVPGQIRIMKLLRRCGPMTMNDLALATEVSAPTVSGIVKRLVTQGIVSRTPAPHDGRVIVVDLTPEGLAAMNAFRQSRIDALQQKLAALDPVERDAIAQALPALNRLLDLHAPSGCSRAARS